MTRLGNFFLCSLLGILGYFGKLLGRLFITKPFLMAGSPINVLSGIENVFTDLFLLFLSLGKGVGIRGGIFSKSINLLCKFLSFLR